MAMNNEVALAWVKLLGKNDPYRILFVKKPNLSNQGSPIAETVYLFQTDPPKTWRTSEGEQLMQNQNPENKVSCEC